MNGTRSPARGFSVVEVTIALLAVVVLATGGWYMYQYQRHTHNPEAGLQANRPPAVNRYAGWKTYTSKLGKFTLRYPSHWSLSGFQVETPVGPSYATGEMTGQETQIRLVHAESASNEFGMDIMLSGLSERDGVDGYPDGSVTILTNGLSVWVHKNGYSAGAGRTESCPAIRIVSGDTFAARLSNGTVLVSRGSFCWRQDSETTLNYAQQVGSASFRQAKQIIESIKAQ